MIGDHVFESYSKEEVMEFKDVVNPDIWELKIQRSLDDLKKIYILKYSFLDIGEADKAWKRYKQYKRDKEESVIKTDKEENLADKKMDYKQYISIEWLKKYASHCCTFDMNLAAIHFVQTWIDMNEKCCCEKKEHRL